MKAHSANLLNNALMLSTALGMFYLLDGGWRLAGFVPLLCTVFRFSDGNCKCEPQEEK